MRRFISAVVTTALVLSAVIFPVGAASAAPMPGAIWTTDIGGTVNQNHYETKPEVYLNGGPVGGQSQGLPDGQYYIMVTEPNGTVLGKSTETTAVVGGWFAQHFRLVDIVRTASSGFTVLGFDDTTNPGNEYKVWASKNPAFPNSESKTDNFKVKEGIVLIEKTWRAQVPAILLELVPDVSFWAYYSNTDPQGDPNADVDWVFVSLEREGDTVYFSATTEHEPGDVIWFWWQGVGTGYAHMSAVDGPEEIVPGLTNGYVFPSATKNWLLVGPTGFDYSAAYSVDGDNWIEVPLAPTPVEGVYEASTQLPDGLSIYFKWIARKTGQTEIFWESAVYGPELLEGVVDNDIELTHKMWRVYIGAPVPEGATFGASWSDDSGATWNDVELAPDNGTWNGESLFVTGTSIMWRFYLLDAAGREIWTSGVRGPEELGPGHQVNATTYAQPRTIGFWMNWSNHFSRASMDTIVAEVNSDANGFSTVFRGGPPSVTDTGQYMLRSGDRKKRSSVGDVAWWLGQAQDASSMHQMLRAQLLGVELNAAATQTGTLADNGAIVGLSTGATVYLTKVPGWDTSANPWGTNTPTVMQVIQMVEANAANDWAGWGRPRQEFAKNVLDAINNYGHGGPADLLILEP